MSEVRSQTEDDHSPTLFLAINRACERFEADWRGGGRPAIEERLGEVVEARTELLRELLATELEMRRSAGERPSPEEYRARFPDDLATVEAAFDWTGAPLSSPLAPTEPVAVGDRRSADPGRNLLLGFLALQNNFVDRDTLMAAFAAWTADKSRPLGDWLVERGALDAPRRALLDMLVIEHLRLYQGDAERSLATLNVDHSTRVSFLGLGDPGLDTTILRTTRAEPAAGRYSVDSSSTLGRRFRVVRPHAQGGLGAIFVAIDAELNREVALKQILDRHADDLASRYRFLMEAEITARLEHPGIVPVYGLGAYDDGRPFYAMRFIRGDSLKQAIAADHADPAIKADPGLKALALSKLLRRFLDVCNAIDYAHSRGVLHRDVKPGNVIVGRYGETLVVDWGLAKPMGEREVTSSNDERTLRPASGSGLEETMAGTAMGTPAYMSPEQAGGEIDRLGPRSDVYSLGATLYSLLTGKSPFTGELDRMILQVRRGEFQPPRQVDPTIDRGLEAVCLKAMATDPADRYPTARALADDVERWLADEPVTAYREPIVRRARRWGRRNRTAATAAAVAVLVAMAGLASVLAVEARANAGLKSSNEALIDANERVRTTNDELRAAYGRERERFSLAIDAVKLFHGEVSEDLLLKEPAFQGLRTKLLRGAADFYGKLEGLLKGRSDRPSRAALGMAYEELGELTDKIGSKPEALAAHRKSLAVRRDLATAAEADNATRADVARSLLAVAWLQHRTGDLAGALRSNAEARRWAEGLAAGADAGDPIRAVLGSAYHQIGRVFEDTGDPSTALAYYRRGLAIQQGLADAHPDNARFEIALGGIYESIARLLSDGGKTAEALEASRQALAVRRKLADAAPDDLNYQSQLAAGHHGIGYQLQLAGDPIEALAAYSRALTIRQELADAYPNATGFQFALSHSYEGMGWVLKLSGRPAEALDAFQRASAILEELVAAHPDVTDWQSHLAINLGFVAELYVGAGRIADAVASIRRSVGILDRLPSRTNLDLYNLACGHSQLAGLAARPGSGMSETEGRAEADRGMERLFQAVAAGYRKRELIRTDPDLDSLRSRPDFRALMMDLAFPRNVFAR